MLIYLINGWISLGDLGGFPFHVLEELVGSKEGIPGGGHPAGWAQEP